jgi:hypothetical protein
MARRGDPIRTSPGATMFPDLGRARPRQREAGGLKGRLGFLTACAAAPSGAASRAARG